MEGTITSMTCYHYSLVAPAEVAAGQAHLPRI